MAPFAHILEIKLDASSRDAFDSLLRDNAKVTRAEAGCLSYTVHVADEDPHRYVLYQIFADEAAFEVHRQSPHLEHFREQAGGMFTLEKVTNLGTRPDPD